jgi:hypothetical protein
LGLLALSLSSSAAPPATPAPVLDKTMELTAARKMAGADRELKKDEIYRGPSRKASLVYNITVHNASLTEVGASQLKYIIFMEREKLGSKTEAMERIKGNATVNPLKAREKQVVETEDFSLNASRLAPGWSYVGGGKNVAKDSVKGIWVRLYRDGALVNELISPNTLAAKEAWRD